ncbi:PREDICTED: F-box/LRR-repeat protein 20-like isoform X1 [Thamnophis sirtalis]|uniref:F-box/LRR-repeat protein 20-like isoform X1 n=1 Tax=Thamnophis sirtalis TaxID=35019 RepID=A0A6I9YRZ9_9SAUR|nr:PREDICTED: F-box/LRR-repeat protein 20-like isoform X1 [Thamnophis sirtalis]
MDTCRLPVEVITYILNFLPISDRKEASLVDRTWYFAAQDSLRQENVLYNIPATSASLGTIRSLAQRHVYNVKMANLDSSTTSRDVVKCTANYLGPHLRSLCLNGSCLTEASFEELLLACPNLIALDLSGCNSIFMSGTLLSKKEILLQAQEALANLQELNMSSVRYLSDLTFNRLTSCCPQLAKLALARCHITFEFDSYSGSHNYNSSALLSFRNLVHFLGRRAAGVKSLDLSGTNINGQAMRTLVQVGNLQLQEFILQACRDLTNEAVSVLCQHQPHLTTLDLSGCSELSDQAGLAISSRLFALQCLRLGKLPRLTDAGFQGISHLKHLQSLDVSECSLVSCTELVKAFGTNTTPPKLKSLKVAFCSLVRDSTVLSLAEALSKNLQVLDLSSCVSLSNRSVQAITSRLLRLTVLRLAWCKELTDEGLLGIEEPRKEHESAKEKDAGPKFSRNFGNMGFFLPPPQFLEQDKMMVIHLNQQKAQEQRQTSLNALTRLQELDLTACGKLTDMSIAKVISFPDLRYLSLSLVPNITDTSLLAVARNCRSLEHLALSHCTNLTDGGFAEAAESLCRLQHLVLSGCNQLTPRTLKSIGRKCQLLKSLDISMCSQINMADVERFQSQLPPQSNTSIQSRFVGGADLSITL